MKIALKKLFTLKLMTLTLALYKEADLKWPSFQESSSIDSEVGTLSTFEEGSKVFIQEQ